MEGGSILMKPSIIPILDLLDEAGVEYITYRSGTFVEEEQMYQDDADFVTFHKGEESPWICDLINICDHQTLEKPIYKDWHMTVNYHS